MKFHNYVVFDCETGGLDKKNGLHAINFPITQIAFVGIDGYSLTEINRYEAYIKGKHDRNFVPTDNDVVPGYVGYGLNQVYTKGAFLHTNTTVEKLENLGQEAKQVCLEIIDLFESIKSSSKFHKIILVGHNVIYDIPFLQYLFKLFNKDLDKYIEGYRDAYGNFQPVFFDTQYLSRARSTDEKLKHNLTDVAFREGIELIDAHNAMPDTLATKNVFVSFLHSFRNSKLSNNQSESTQISKFRDSFAYEY